MMKSMNASLPMSAGSVVSLTPPPTISQPSPSSPAGEIQLAGALHTDGVNAAARSSFKPDAATSWMASRHALPAVIEM